MNEDEMWEWKREIVKILQENHMTENQKKLFHLGNEVVRIRNILSEEKENRQFYSHPVYQMLSDILELVNEIRIIGYSNRDQSKHHFCEKMEGTIKISCFFSDSGKLWCSISRVTGTMGDFSQGFDCNFCPICGFDPNEDA